MILFCLKSIKICRSLKEFPSAVARPGCTQKMYTHTNTKRRFLLRRRLLFPSSSVAVGKGRGKKGNNKSNKIEKGRQ